MIDALGPTTFTIAILAFMAGAIAGAGIELLSRRIVRSETAGRANPPASRKLYRTAGSAALYATAAAIVLFVRGASAETVELLLLMGILLLISLIDLETRRIPNGCIAAALIVRFLYWAYAYIAGFTNMAEIGYHIASALCIGAALLALTLAADALFHQESMGGGDLKLYFVAALYFGWQDTLLVVFGSCLIALAGWAVSRILHHGGNTGARPSGERECPDNTMPFGPAISIACMAPILLGSPSKLLLLL